MKFGPYTFSDTSFPIIAGPCVIESKDHVMKMAMELAKIRDRLNLQLVFKTSFDKANRSSAAAYRGTTLETALPIFEQIRKDFGMPVLTDIHSVDQPDRLKSAVDVIQIPAFLSRQTDLLQAAGRTGLPVNVKKGQFLSPWEVSNILEKLKQSGCMNFTITERGTTFGYNNLVADMRAIPIIRDMGVPVIFDATHSAQLPGGAGDQTSGMREYVPAVARAAVAAGCDGLFMEVHDRPAEALSDPMTQWPLDEFENLIRELLAFRRTYMEVRH